MSDVPSSLVDSSSAVETVTAIEPSSPIWPYVVGVLIALAVAGFYIYKYVNRPSFLIKQIRKRNKKAMAKQGIDANNEAMVDLDKLLSAVEFYALEQKMTGSATVKLLSPLNDQKRIKNAKDMYQTMQNIAKSINNQALANELKQRMAGVKANSRLMAGLFKRAGI